MKLLVLVGDFLPKAGIFAVRMGPVLDLNLFSVLNGKLCRPIPRKAAFCQC
jgi:hypothetical protein